MTAHALPEADSTDRQRHARSVAVYQAGTVRFRIIAKVGINIQNYYGLLFF